jgi:ABC-type transport system involved in multi-copper enzyme maturation permease subunit
MTPPDFEEITPETTISQATTDAAPAQVAPKARSARVRPMAAMRGTAGGLGAVGVKELRGRMRGRRAFVIMTIYLVLLGGFAWMMELIMERTYSSGFGGSAAFASAQIGQVIFAALLMLETLQVAFLAPSATAGAISMEREKQTLELLIVTPISSFAIVFGKLLSALVYVWLLIAASIPLTAVVFVYGGVAPDDVLRGYIVLIVTALGFGALGLFASSMVKRTTAATAISIFSVLFISLGTIFVLIFWQAMATSDNGRGVGPIKGSPPAVIAWINPFLAQIDVLCGTETSSGGFCSIQSSILQDRSQGVIFQGQTGGGVAQPLPIKGGVALPGGGAVQLGPVDANGNPMATDENGNFVDSVGNRFDQNGNPIAPNGAPFGVARDTFWTKSVATWLVLSVILLFGAVQFVSPTRRWRLRRRQRTQEVVA